MEHGVKEIKDWMKGGRDWFDKVRMYEAALDRKLDKVTWKIKASFYERIEN